jgi:anti-sigma B factor antagonist
MEYRRKDNGSVSYLEIDGELDANTAVQLREPFDLLLADGRDSVHVDLSGLRMIDSSGIGALVSLYKRVRARGGNVEIRNAVGQPAAILKLLKLDSVFGARCIQEAQHVEGIVGGGNAGQKGRSDGQSLE